MIPLYRCRACGFLSTIAGEFKREQHVLFDKDCLQDWRDGRQPRAEWVCAALASKKSDQDG